MTLKEVPGAETGRFACDLILHAATKDPHSGIHGGPFPVAELQLARMIDKLVGADGMPRLPDADKYFSRAEDTPVVRAEPLFAENDGTARPFANPTPKTFVEVRLAPGNREDTARERLRGHLLRHVLPGFELVIRDASRASPWITGITHPIFPLVLKALEIGYNKKPCLYGCGGSIPFVPKLTNALGGIPPLCLGAYDPDGKMHEPGESMSLVDWMGCARSLVHLFVRAPEAFPHPRPR
jgi:acetylornithine deacetylase/succinyl-diaminopimelate desuccinylase-like protein